MLIIAVKTPNLKDMSYDAAEKKAQSLGLNLVKIGSGSKITDQVLTKGQKQESGSKVFVLTSGKITCPDMKGWGIEDLHQFASLSGVKINIDGNGRVQSQSVKPGTTLTAGTKININLKE